MKRLGLVLLIITVAAFKAHATDKAIVKWARTGPRIDSIIIEGNHYFSEDQIKKHLYSRKRTVWLAIKGDRRSHVQRETLDRDTLEVKYLYLSSGFLNVHVQHSYQPILPDSSAIVRLHIDEGPRYLFGIGNLSGVYDRQYHVRLRELVSRLERSAPANLFLMSETENAIKTFLSNRGYPYARISYAIDTTGRPDSCDVTFTVDADSLVHFGNVTVEVANPKADGRARYPEYASVRELKIVPGGVYRRDDLLESQRRLFEAGYFTTFQLSQSENSFDRLHPDFRLSLTERKSTYLTFRVGAAQSGVRDLEWDLSAGAGQRNVWGSRTLEGTAALSFSAGKDTRLLDNRFTMRFVEPWFIRTRTKLTIAAEYQPRLTDPLTLRFDKESWSLSTVFSRSFGRKMRASLGLEYQKVKLSNIPDWEIPIIKEQAGISERRKIYVTLRRDSREDVFIPKQGSVAEFGGDFFGGFLGGDANFFKLQASWSRYRLVWPGWVAALRLKGAWAQEFDGSSAVPLDEALFIGGANSIRGVQENHLGPLDADGNPVGARYIALFNQEFRWKTVQFLTVLPFLGDFMSRFPLWQSIFVDIGNGFRNTDEMLLKNLAVAYGFGFQIVSPAGPVRIDYAELLEHHDFDYSHRWHFTILYAF